MTTRPDGPAGTARVLTGEALASRLRKTITHPRHFSRAEKDAFAAEAAARLELFDQAAAAWFSEAAALVRDASTEGLSATAAAENLGGAAAFQVCATLITDRVARAKFLRSQLTQPEEGGSDA